MPDLNLSAYLDRLGTSPVTPSRAGLFALQQAQLQAIPFESLDAFLGIVPDVSLAAVQDKILGRGRGGYCFELNTLFGAALVATGFRVERRMARVRNGAAEGGARSHLVLVVTVDDQRFLADAGFGGPGALVPLVLDDAAPQQAPNGRYRIVAEAATGEHVVQRMGGDGWMSLYGFDAVPVRDVDIVAANHLCATWAGAPFLSHLMISRYDAAGRVGIFDMAVTEQTGDGESRRTFRDGDDFAALLTGRVGLAVDAATLGAAWRKLAGG